MVSSFDPHSMCKNVERVTAKTGCTSCTRRTIYFKVSGFHMETRLLQRDFIFLNLFELHSFSVLKMQHSKPHHQFSTLSDIICYFQLFTDLFRELNDREIENHYKMNSEYVETWHGIIIHPHSMCKIVERLTVKTGRTSCTNWKISFGVSGFRTTTHLLHGHFIFLNLFELQTFFLRSYAPFIEMSSVSNRF